MTYFKQQVEAISSELYANVYLVKQVIQSKQFIDKNFSDKITLDSICRAAHISKFHLIRSFKSLYGQTPNQYLISVRIERAKELLKAGDSVLEACFSVGFESSTTFAGLFKKMAGMGPNQFRSSQRKKQF